MVIKLSSSVYGFKHTIYANNEKISELYDDNGCSIEVKTDSKILQITLKSEEYIPNNKYLDRFKELCLFLIGAPFTYNFYDFNIYKYCFKFKIYAQNFDSTIVHIRIDNDISMDSFGKINIDVIAINGEKTNIETVRNVDKKILQYHFDTLKKNRLYTFIISVTVFALLFIIGLIKSIFVLSIFSSIIIAILCISYFIGCYIHKKMHKKAENCFL